VKSNGEISMAVSAEQFNRVAELAIKHTERTYPEFVNGQMFRLATFTIRETERADDAKIGYRLGHVGTKIRRRRKDGKLIKGQLIYSDSDQTLAARIINKRRRDRGEQMLFGKELAKAVRRFIGASMRSSEFIRSGWVPGAREFARAVGLPPKMETKRTKGKPKGYGITAKPTLSGVVTGEMANTALLAESSERTGSRKGNPMPIAQAGLDRGRALWVRDVLDHLAKKLAPGFKKFSAP
jgi:hypothetical protein